MDIPEKPARYAYTSCFARDRSPVISLLSRVLKQVTTASIFRRKQLRSLVVFLNEWANNLFMVHCRNVQNYLGSGIQFSEAIIAGIKLSFSISSFQPWLFSSMACLARHVRDSFCRGPTVLEGKATHYS